MKAAGSRTGQGSARGERYGRYTLIDRIARGGMADVYSAVRAGSGKDLRLCVVKRIRADRVRSPDLIQMFSDEARITALLRHPNIIRAYEFGRFGESCFLSMEYIEGRNLSSLLEALDERDMPIPVHLAAHIVREVAQGLAYAHTRTCKDNESLGIIHRDISPVNIMLRRNGDVKILDFGVAKARARIRDAQTRIGRIKGKITYMSPEQLRGMPLDARTDIFSLGIVFWEMLAGRRLFDHGDGADTIAQLQKRIDPPSKYRTEIPAALDSIVMKCLAPDPAQRCPSASALVEWLAPLVGDSESARLSLASLMGSTYKPTGRAPVLAATKADSPNAGKRPSIESGTLGGFLRPPALRLPQAKPAVANAVQVPAAGEATALVEPEDFPILRSVTSTLAFMALLGIVFVGGVRVGPRLAIKLGQDPLFAITRAIERLPGLAVRAFVGDVPGAIAPESAPRYGPRYRLMQP